MSDHGQLRLLGSERDVDDDELPGLYGYPAQPPRAWVRANFIASLDGGATLDGRSGGLGGTGDRVVFTVLRELADVIMVGAGTVRAENYGGAHLDVTRRQHRQARGQSEVPRLAVVTNSGHLDRDMRVFSETELPPLVLTCADAAEHTRGRLAGVADVIACSGSDPARLDEAVALAALAERGLPRVLTEGGPTLLGALIERGLLDELCLTIAPCVVGGASRRIAAGPGEALRRMRCAHVLGDDAGYLYTRYLTDG